VDEFGQSETLLRLAGNALNALLDGLGQIDEETRDKIMRLCGEACAKETIWGPALDIAERISREEKNIDRIIERVNNEISWCDKWIRERYSITATCSKCGCPLVRLGVVRNTEVFCNCSKGWVETIFSTLLQKPVTVRLERAMGRGDDVCRYIVHLEGDRQ
jgi:predicted hydrocarbon binding protein